LSPSAVGWTFLFPEAAAVAERVSPQEVAPASVHFRVLEADFLVPGAGSLAQEADSRELVGQHDSAELPRSLVLVVDFLEPVAAFGWAELLAYSPEVHLLSPAADSRERAVRRDSPGLSRSRVPVTHFLGPVAASGWAGLLAYSPVVHLLGSAAGSRELAVRHGSAAPPRSLVRAVDFLVLAAASCWAGQLAYSLEVHLLSPAAGSRELAEQRGSAELAHSRALAVDSRVPPAWAALLEAFQLTVAEADWLAVLLLGLPAVMLQVSHLPSSDTQLGWPA
jgi:hypothetical protein